MSVYSRNHYREDNPVSDEPRWLTAPEQRAWRAYILTNLQLMEELNRELQDRCGLTHAEYRILVLLSEAPEYRLRMSDLADGILSSRSRLTHQINRMEGQRLVRRVAAPDDGRGVYAQATPTGLQTLEAAAPGHVEDVRRNFVDLLSAAQLEVIAEAFETIQEAITNRQR